MVNTQYLDEKINSSGLKNSFIIEKLGISPQAYYKKKNNQIKFRCAEAYVISDLLNLSDDEKRAIFFAE